MENSVESIIKKIFSSRSYSEKLKIVTAGKRKPKLNMTTNYKSKKKNFCNILIILNYFRVSQTTILSR